MSGNQKPTMEARREREIAIIAENCQKIQIEQLRRS
jgi:hypothetical protein